MFLRMLLQNPASEMVVEESEIRNLELNSIIGISMNTEYLIDQLKEADRYETSLEDIKNDRRCPHNSRYAWLCVLDFKGKCF